MDTSKKYIKMCEKAKEIQDNRRGRSYDDLFFHKDCIKMIEINGFGFGKKGEMIIEQKYGYNYKSDLRPKEWNDYCIWLPRQGQLQEMIKVEDMPHIPLVRNFYTFVVTAKSAIFMVSMEQLWLVFVMREKYGKIWNGKNWEIKSSTREE
jgi:hypothetical protein